MLASKLKPANGVASRWVKLTFLSFLSFWTQVLPDALTPKQFYVAYLVPSPPP